MKYGTYHQNTDMMIGLRDEMRSLLRQCLAIPSISGDEAAFVNFLVSWAQDQRLEVDFWDSGDTNWSDYPGPIQRHLPFKGRPVAVVRLAGRGGGRSIAFNGHTDVVPPGHLSAWSNDPWSGTEIDEQIFGRGACDVKGAIVSALWAIVHVQRSGVPIAGDVLLELIPGEEDAVGLGTFASVNRGWKADASIILEPTENQPRCASRGGVRFEITVTQRHRWRCPGGAAGDRPAGGRAAGHRVVVAGGCRKTR